MSNVYSLKSRKYDCQIFFDSDDTVLLLPTLFSMSISKNGMAWVSKVKEEDDGTLESVLEQSDISETTQTIYNNRLTQFLNWLSSLKSTKPFNFLTLHHNPDTQFLNDYINNVIIKEKGAGARSVDQHVSCLRAYYNFLAVAGLTTKQEVFVRSKLKSKARENTKTRSAYKYLSPELRNALYQNAPSLRDELLLRTGGELGLRTKENRGFLLNNYREGRSSFKGLKSLFKDMKEQPKQETFEYYLLGKFTKGSKNNGGGNSRTVKINRRLLSKFEKYYLEERPNSRENTFFLTDAKNHKGFPISKSQASIAFSETKKIIMALQSQGLYDDSMQALDKEHTHHILRHSFATDEFYDTAKRYGIHFSQITNLHPAYLYVASLLGHTATGKLAPATTARYIRSCHLKEQLQHEQ